MEFVLPIAIGLSILLAVNIGANNSAASMATAYGAGARSKREAVTLIAIFALLGALIAGSPVIKTLGKGLVPESVLSTHIGLVLIVFIIAIVFISWANLVRVPIATTHAIVCAIAGGAILLGGRVLKTVGKEIIEICILRGISVEITGATLLLIASLFGIPVSLAEIITSGIIGFSCAQQGFTVTAQNRHVARIVFFWFVVPFIAIGLSYMLSSIYFKYDFRGIVGRNF